MMTAKEIRQAFKDFFASKSHQIVASAPMVVKDDPTLMFTNAGMNQFKDIFLGNSPIKYPRVANSQKCLRVSGKHNDLEEVGHDTYHHTMFEMLGNWSFGDYFKEEAIDWAWEFLVTVMGMNPDRMYATIFEGSAEEGIERDNEAASYWAKYLPKERIILGNKKDNFWEMGDTGPCGPCTEIHVDLRSEAERAMVDGLTLVNESHPQVIEIWNNVFIQFNRKADGSLEPLAAKHVDTGMGFERLCMAIQGKTSNYDTDVFQPIITEIGRLAGKKYGDHEPIDIAMRVIADHIRTISFSIADGQLPSNVKAGYVIRRILRRAVRYGYTYLGQHHAFMYKLLPVLIEVMGDAYPELVAQQVLISKVIREEEESFLRTLETGIRLLDKVMSETRAAGSKIVAGTAAFELYDTFGFPLDLTELILRENNLEVDRNGFDTEMQKQKERARNAAAVETGDWIEIAKAEKTVFVGYDALEADVQIVRTRQMKTKGKTLYQLVFDVTPFYAESGGQLGDSGYIDSGSEKIIITDTKKENNLIVHLCEKLPADLTAGFHAVVDVEKRMLTANNHSATHLLHQALREVLGTHVEQKGSLVCADYLRFDFAHFNKVTPDELAKVETIVNKRIRKNFKLQEHRDVAYKQALEMGAMALFGEKYGDVVRAIQFGDSVELCAGTHVAATGQIGLLKITSEGSISAGIRRIEAVTADKAEALVNDKIEQLAKIAGMLNAPADVLKSVESMLAEIQQLRKEVEESRKQKLTQLKNELLAKITTKGDINILCELVQLIDIADLKDLSYQIKSQVNNLVCILGTVAGEKAGLSVLLADEIVAQHKLNAGAIVREAAKAIQGGGGGQPFFATAGGKKPEGIGEALAKALELTGL